MSEEKTTPETKTHASILGEIEGSLAIVEQFAKSKQVGDMFRIVAELPTIFGGLVNAIHAGVGTAADTAAEHAGDVAKSAAADAVHTAFEGVAGLVNQAVAAHVHDFHTAEPAPAGSAETLAEQGRG